MLMGKGGGDALIISCLSLLWVVVSSDDVTNMAVKGLKWSALYAIIMFNSL